ncbi:AMP-binding enzyme [Ornithinimicrobium faecis]|uniref:AMP-binding enzyme n=1 Tax=Ornithinimicrobium faecis TaxID=2934158 RepID=UPI003CE46F69
MSEEKRGGRPRAFVTLRSGVSVTNEDLVAHARSRLAGYKVPREFMRLDELPHTATGKIGKFELRGRDSAKDRVGPGTGATPVAGHGQHPQLVRAGVW